MSKKDKTNSVNNEKIMDPIEYLEKTGLTSSVKEAISLLIENRPKDPITFLSQYFLSFVEDVSVVKQAQRIICLTHHSRPAYDDNIVTAYKILRDKGLNGKVHNELVKNLCIGIPPVISERILEKIACRDVDAIPQPLFYSNVLTCLVAHDYKKHAELLYKELGNLCDRGVCDALLHLLCQDNITKYDINTNVVSRTISSAQAYSKNYISCEAFVIAALNVYVNLIAQPS